MLIAIQIVRRDKDESSIFFDELLTDNEMKEIFDIIKKYVHSKRLYHYEILRSLRYKYYRHLVEELLHYIWIKNKKHYNAIMSIFFQNMNPNRFVQLYSDLVHIIIIPPAYATRTRNDVIAFRHMGTERYKEQVRKLLTNVKTIYNRDDIIEDLIKLTNVQRISLENNVYISFSPSYLREIKENIKEIINFLLTKGFLRKKAHKSSSYFLLNKDVEPQLPESITRKIVDFI